MVIWSVLGVLLLLLILSIGIIVIEFKRKTRGIIVSSSYLKLFITGITIAFISICGMVALFIYKIPFYIAMPLLVMGIIYIGVSLIYRREWLKWLEDFRKSTEEPVGG